MPRPPLPRIVIAFFILTLASAAGALAFGANASSEVVEPDAVVFGRLRISPANLSFKVLNFNSKKAQPSSEQKPLTIENTGRGASSLTVQVGAITGADAAAFSISPGPSTYQVLNGKNNATTFQVTFTPAHDGRSTAEIAISSSDTNGQRGATARVIHLTGNARGPIPGGSSSATPSATPTPAPGSNATDKNSSNAPGVLVNGKTVTVFVPQGSDDLGNTGTQSVVVENGGNALPSPSLIATDRVVSCTPAQSGQLVCAGQGGTVDLVPAASSSPAIQNISPLPNTINYANGDCIACGAMVDDSLGLGIISSGAGYYLLNLSNGTLSSPIATNTNPPSSSDPLEVPGMDFGYDSTHHLILSANWQVTDLQSFTSSPAHFQIINITNPSSPAVFDLADDQTVFKNNGRTCGSTNTPTDTLPDTTALDTSTNIAYVTFHTKADCFNSPPDDIAMFDLSQASFSASKGTWTTPAILFQSITGTALNGIDAISVESNSHLAMVSAGDANIGVLQLPTASGGNSASLAVTDWVNAVMPNDPDGAQWAGWGEPNGVATYVSPNSGKVIGVLMNNPANQNGSTFLALIDMQALLAAPRDNAHQIFAPIASPIVTFVKIK
ncbi:MAG TPA: hypothetical protein VMT64_14755 [Candidatus Binataceae bacterium]|nr:hypothetical protein [Candidatus Binataceae bacterium]